jgi:hypothetical protein
MWEYLTSEIVSYRYFNNEYNSLKVQLESVKFGIDEVLWMNVGKKKNNSFISMFWLNKGKQHNLTNNSNIIFMNANQH